MARKAIPAGKLLEDSKHFVEALILEGPLACALIGGAAVENALMTLLSNFFVEGSENVFDIGGCLESASKCAAVAYCLGFISKEGRENLKLIARIRNKFAHSHVPIDFDDTEVVESCSKLKPEKGWTATDWKSQFPRVKFSFTAAALFSFLMRTADGVTRRPKCEDHWSTK